ncbi:ATP-binding cassette, subfamily B, AbcA/BmrA [Priestia endophytica DSM 13796]|uniref:ATP-binding cassette, subfamily B, AbcA/BmrA n=2 Tax=Priestia endophytica TaxID=135735 RepID=A0A1I6BV24_9BACI|nr:ATP-binding cassette, subfamily B, AbcA/BmrA [Priestia endophytica DSM 13796]
MQREKIEVGMKKSNYKKKGHPYQTSKWRGFWNLIIRRRPTNWIMIAALVFGMGEALLSLLIPLITMNLVDTMSNANFQLGQILTIIVVFLIQAITSGFSIYTMSYVGQYIISKLREDLWTHILTLGIPFFDQHTSGDTMSRVTNDTNIVKYFITMHVVPFFSSIISILGAVALLFFIDWRITIILIIATPVMLFLIRPLGTKMYSVSMSLQDETANFQSELGRVLSDIRLVKASKAEALENKKGKTRINNLFYQGLREAKLTSIVSPLVMTVMLTMLVTLIGYGGVRVTAGTLTAGELVAIILYIFQVILPFTQMASFYTEFQKAMGATERINYILNKKSESVCVQVSDYPLLSNRQPLLFNNVNFSYQKDKPILNKVSFHAEVGKVTALVGPSGSGKTTIFSLIERFYEPCSGEISYGDMKISSLKLSDWRRRIAYVSQESPIMAGTIRENLIYGLKDVTDKEIHMAVEQASLTSFINSLPDGYNTQVGERGVKLSGGQRQRMAIARAILRDPDVLLLDEATAHLDSESEYLVQKALELLMESRTTILIAHRLSTVRNAHKIIVLEQGEVTGEGTHKELNSKHDFYQKLVEQQFLKSYDGFLS